MLIVGAGVAGSVAALRLARAGFGVVCLEQGGWTDPSEFPGSKPEWELLSSRQWHPNPNVRGRPADYPCETSDSDVNPLMWSGVGRQHDPLLGALGALPAVRLPRPVARRDRRRLALRLRRPRAVLRAGGTGLRGLRRGRRSGLSGGRQAHRFHRCRSARSAGERPRAWTGSAGTGGLDRSRIASRAHGNLRACGLRGTCLTGCPDRAKATTDLTHWPEALERGVRLVTGARVNAITTDARGRASGATYIDRAGQRAPPGCRRRDRLRERSRHAPAPAALGARELLGPRREATHDASLCGSRRVLRRAARELAGPTGQSIQSMQFYETDESRGFVRGGKWQVMSTGGPLGLRAAYGGAPLEERFGESLHRNLREQLGRGLEWGVIAEDLPEDSNYVALDRGAHRLGWRPGAQRSCTATPTTRARCSTSISRDCTRRTRPPERSRRSPRRSCATAAGICSAPARWATIPRRSVVDADGRAHDVPNLYVYDGSVFPTSAGVNPTATIAAVSLRLRSA